MSNSSHKLSIILIICFVLQTTLSFGDELSEKLSQINDQISQLAAEGEFNQIHMIKKRFILNLNYDELSDKNILQVAEFLGFQNDYIASGILAIEYEFGMKNDEAIINYCKKYNIPPYAIKTNYKQKSPYSKYAKEYKLNADEIIKTYSDVYGDEVDKAAIGVGVGAGAVAAGAAALMTTTIGGTALIASGTAAYAISAGAATTAILSGPVIIVGAPAIVIGGGAYAGYKSYKKRNLNKKINPILNQCSEYYDTPINKSWKEAIIDYKNVITVERSESVKATQSIYRYLESNNFSIQQLSKFTEITHDNDAHYYTLDALLRFYLFDEPLRKYILLNNIKLNMAKGIINDNEEQIIEVGKSLNKAYAIIDNTSSQETRNMLTEAMVNIKSELNPKQFEQMKMESKLGINWINI